MGDAGARKHRQPVKLCTSREDVKLHEMENEWHPVYLNKSKFASEEDEKTEELYKKVRRELNKLTPQNFETVLLQIKALDIDTAERLLGVADLVFEKAVEKPNFSVAYALMCRELALLRVPSNSTKEKFINFRKLIISKCQLEFEKQCRDESVRNEKVKEIEACTDAKRKKDLQFDLEEYDRELRLKSVGTIRFIGELFKQNMSTVNILLRCLNNLIENKDEESLECLCELLMTIGKELERRDVDLSMVFNSMKNITDNEDKFSSRIRSMLQDVMDLRNSKWVPRRQDLNPKTIDEQEHAGPNSNVNRKGWGHNVSNVRWILNSKGNRPQFFVKSDKLKSKAVPPKRNNHTKIGGAAHLDKRKFATQEDKTEDIYKKVRCVLNTLTPQNFETLLSQIKALHIDTAERLQGVADLVSEKAVETPNFSVAYALMCRELALMQGPTSNSTEEKPEFVNFRKLLITRCQVEFEKQNVDESVRNERVKEIEACLDAEKKKDLQFDLEEYDRRMRMKSVGNIRFIGELFKQDMLTVNIMLRCLNNLLENKDEESLECLCKLLTTVGKELETKSVDLAPIFNTMKNIAEKEEGKVSSRIRFMLQDVIDLRNSKWVPRRQDLNPKTIDQIQKETDNEQMNIQLMNSVPMTPRREERAGPNSNVDRKGRGRNVSDDGWILNSNWNRTQFTVQSDELKSKAPQIDEPLSSSQLFGGWGKGSVASNFMVQPQSLSPNTNMYARLENIETERRPLSSRPDSKEPCSSKGPSLERSFGKSYDGRGSWSGSQHRPNDSSASSSQRSSPDPAISPAPSKPIRLAPVMQRLQEQIERRINNSLDEYVNSNCTVDEYFLHIRAVVLPSQYSGVIEHSYLRVLKKSQQARLKTGTLFAMLIKLGRIQLEDYCAGLEGTLSQADDLEIDIPKIWDYLAEVLVNLICEEVLPLSSLQKSFQILIGQGHAVKVLAPLFKLVIREKGPKFLQNACQESGLHLTDFMPSSEVNSFIKDNQFEFLIGGGASVVQNNLSYDQIQNKLSEFLRNNVPLGDITKWITENVGDNVKEKKFIRALATAVFENSISKNYKLMDENLMTHSKLLLKYVNNNSDYELQCLYALQALIYKGAQGLLLSICDKLNEGGTFSQESFILWQNSTDPAEQEGKDADRLNEIYEENSSGESSARHTPQLTPPSHNKEVQAAFAKQVMRAINSSSGVISKELLYSAKREQ